VVAGVRELEHGPGVAVWAAALPGAGIECFHALAVQTEEGVTVAGFPELDDPGLVTLFVDPFSFPAEAFLARLNEEHEQIPLVGGIAGGGRRSGTQALILDDAVRGEGAVCRPIGGEAVITRCQGDEYNTGDYLMRGPLGLDETSGALALGDTVRVGQTLRFFVRDAASADADLRRALAGALRQERSAGALLFTCNGRGTQMFPEPDHDARIVAAALRTQALAGFCGGEIGPVGGKAFLHGFTATWPSSSSAKTLRQPSARPRPRTSWSSARG